MFKRLLSGFFLVLFLSSPAFAGYRVTGKSDIKVLRGVTVEQYSTARWNLDFGAARPLYIYKYYLYLINDYTGEQFKVKVPFEIYDMFNTGDYIRGIADAEE